MRKIDRNIFTALNFLIRALVITRKDSNKSHSNEEGKEE
jgi:hypothetical protein